MLIFIACNKLFNFGLLSMRSFLLLLFAFYLNFQAYPQISKFDIANIISAINTETYRAHFDSLQTLPHHNRKAVRANEQSTDHNLCRDYIYRSFKRYLGYENAYLHAFEIDDFGGLSNVIGVKHGTNRNAGIWVLSAHYDSNNINDQQSGSSSPGANDNGTGLAAILEIARVLANIETEATIVFAAWDLEEIFFDGFPPGSDSWARHFVKKKKATQWDDLAQKGKININDIRGNINFDMLGNPQLSNYGVPVLWVCYAYDKHLGFANDFSSIVNAHVPELKAVSHGRMRLSDHISFASRNIPALLLLESDYLKGPFYHTSNDHVENPENIDYNFATHLTRGSLAYLLENDFEKTHKTFNVKNKRNKNKERPLKKQ